MSHAPNSYLPVAVGVVSGLGFIAVLTILAWPDLSNWVQARVAAVRCPMPLAHEQLHIVVVQRGRNLAAECMYVTSRGMANKAGR